MNFRLVLDLYQLTMAQVYFKYKPNAVATFDLFIRSLNRPFYVAAGIDEALTSVQNFCFDNQDIEYLRTLKLFDEDFLSYLKNFKFKGQIWSVEEPEIVFATEPILKVTANIIEAQIIESILLNRINLATTLATKAARVVLAAKGRSVYDFSLRRTQGIEASLAVAKYSYIVGAKGTSNVYAGLLYKIPVVGTMAHSFVMSFERQIDSFLVFSQVYPKKTILLVDTYDTKKGIDDAVKIAKYLKRKGCELVGIRLDSGDLIEDAKYARFLFDKEGLIDAIIVASGNLDEYKIDQIVKKTAPIDAFGVGTNMGCSADLPFVDVIYKLVEISQANKSFIPTMKLSKNKITLPSRKQVVRIFSGSEMKEDIIILEDEKVKGERLLKKVMQDGVILEKEKSIEEKRKIFAQKISKLPSQLKEVNTNFIYPVKISSKLLSITKKTQIQIKKRITPKLVFFDIDTQNDFLNKKGALYVKDAEKIIPNLKKLTEFAKDTDIYIICSQDTHHSEDQEFKNFPPHCIEGSWGHRKIQETLLKENFLVSYKKTYSKEEIYKFLAEYKQIILQKNVLDVFSNPNTYNLLEQIFPDLIYVYGVVTEYCVKKAIEGLLKAKFKIALVIDAIKEISEQEKEKLFSIWQKEGVIFTTTSKVIKEVASLLK